MKLALVEFGGMAPKIEPRKLAERLATEATNVGFESGALGGMPLAAVPSTDFSPLASSVRAILRPASDGTRLAFTSDTVGAAYASLVVPQDRWGRVYYGTPQGARFTTGEGYIEGQLTINPTSYRLGVPTPVFAPTIGAPILSLDEGEEPPNADEYTRCAYVFTFVDKYGHEGAPSPPSTIVEIPYGVGFATPLTFIAESLPQTNVENAVRRVYRATYDGSSSEFQFIEDVPLAMGEWHDTVPLGEEQEQLMSTGWVPPPEGLTQLCVYGSFMAGFTDNMVAYSEAYLPHAWPEEYRFPTKAPIVGLCPTANGILVATKGKPYWAFGADPAAAVPVELDANHACLSAESMVDMGGMVIYATHDGLVAVSGQETNLITEGFIDRLSWLRDFAPAQIKAFEYEGYYVFGVGEVWWMFDPADGGRGFSTFDGVDITPAQVRQVYYDAMRDTTVVLSVGGEAFDIISASGQEYRWASKVFETPPMSFGVGRVLATEYPVQLEVVSEGGSHSYTVGSSEPFRLHSGWRSRTWLVGVRATGRITEIALAQSAEELL